MQIVCSHGGIHCLPHFGQAINKCALLPSKTVSIVISTPMHNITVKRTVRNKAAHGRLPIRYV
jgi:hypothetical protein